MGISSHLIPNMVVVGLIRFRFDYLKAIQISYAFRLAFIYAFIRAFRHAISYAFRHAIRYEFRYAFSYLLLRYAEQLKNHKERNRQKSQ